MLTALHVIIRGLGLDVLPGTIKRTFTVAIRPMKQKGRTGHWEESTAAIVVAVTGVAQID